MWLGLQNCNFIKRLQHKRFPVNVAKFSRKDNFQELYRTPPVAASVTLMKYLEVPKKNLKSIFFFFLLYGLRLREKCPNTEFFLVRIFLYSDQKKLRICTLFAQFALFDFVRR